MTRIAGKRRKAPEGRSCAHCERPLPASARSWRKFCSSRCRSAAWDLANRPAQDGRPTVRLHWHYGHGGTVLYRNASAGYWRGKGCPPECDRPIEPGGWSTGVPEGREGLLAPPRLKVLERSA